MFDNKNLTELLIKIRDTRIAVIGDFCLDVYWFADLSRSEPSLETGLPTHPVARQIYSLGGAGNVVANLKAMGCGTVYCLGIVGDDPWAQQMLRLLGQVGADTSNMLQETRNWSTLAYVKPHANEQEMNRLDFGNFNQLPDNTAQDLASRLADILPQVDVVVINEQVEQGIHTPKFRAALSALIREHGETLFIVDSRHFSGTYAGALLKINDHEAMRLTGEECDPRTLVMRRQAITAARTLNRRMKNTVFLTRGSRGILVQDQNACHEIPGIQVMGKLDSVGAGDTCLAGIAASLAAGADPVTAANIGNIAASVTIRKLRQTGTADPEEILAAGADPQWVFRPELAEDQRQARYHEGTEIEIVTSLKPDLRAAHVLFDHDGTISTLRQGWEQIMEPFMIRSILGPQYRDASESRFHQVRERVRDYIDKSTGVQTLVQMQGLADMVREFGCVPEQEILDPAGYKAIYNQALMEMVRARIGKFQRHELAVEDLTVKNAVGFLRKLSTAKVRLYLASGTDEADIRAEAEALGYAGLFNGGIFGAVGDVTREAKRMVVERILESIGRGAESGLVAIGDGPVEIREVRKHGGFCVGIASDEIRRFGLNQSKRARLIKAGADIIIPDFSQMDELLGVIGLE